MLGSKGIRERVGLAYMGGVGLKRIRTSTDGLQELLVSTRGGESNSQGAQTNLRGSPNDRKC